MNVLMSQNHMKRLFFPFFSLVLLQCFCILLFTCHLFVVTLVMGVLNNFAITVAYPIKGVCVIVAIVCRRRAVV